MSTTNIYLLPIQNFKSLVKTQDFECQYTYIRTHTKKEPSEIANK